MSLDHLGQTVGCEAMPKVVRKGAGRSAIVDNLGGVGEGHLVMR